MTDIRSAYANQDVMITLPAASGTLALISDLPSIGINDIASQSGSKAGQCTDAAAQNGRTEPMANADLKVGLGEVAFASA